PRPRPGLRPDRLRPADLAADRLRLRRHRRPLDGPDGHGPGPGRLVGPGHRPPRHRPAARRAGRPGRGGRLPMTLLPSRTPGTPDPTAAPGQDSTAARTVAAVPAARAARPGGGAEQAAVSG